MDHPRHPRAAAGPGAPARRRRPRAAAVRDPIRGQGQHRRRGNADDRRMSGVRARRRAQRAGRATAAQRRRAARRQDEHGPVRDRPRRDPQPLRGMLVGVRPGARQRWLELRLGARRRARPRLVRARHRHRRLGSRSGGIQRSDRAQADPGSGQHTRGCARVREHRLCLDSRRRGRRRRYGARRHRRVRPARPMEPASGRLE